MLNGTNAQSREVKLLYSLKKKCDECAITIFSRVGTENDHFEKVMTNLYKNKKKTGTTKLRFVFIWSYIHAINLRLYTDYSH